MDPTPALAVLTALSLAAMTFALWQLHRMRRALIEERAAAHVTEGTQYRDRLALEARLRAAGDRQTAEDAVLAAADQTLTRALATYTTSQDPQEGGTP